MTEPKTMIIRRRPCSRNSKTPDLKMYKSVTGGRNTPFSLAKEKNNYKYEGYVSNCTLIPILMPIKIKHSPIKHFTDQVKKDITDANLRMRTALKNIRTIIDSQNSIGNSPEKP
ncbi:hypothetical protein SteCoe_7358 [Stentor coeruleus]|uniref:Uncharacterized protein n=1 Tax=Stentor coeruleus TaxID=5963 RepID=A0A1R2CN12_9CILI|nr:hypothetical protein SteCoe_7358 [Stentor coeruleus]